MEFKVETGIQIPGRISPNRIHYPFAEMNPGDSFFRAGIKASSMYQNARAWSKKNAPDQRFTSREWNQDGVQGARTWRVK